MYFGRQGILQGHLDLEHCEGQSVHFDFGMLNLAGGLFQLDLVYCTNKYFKLLIGHLYFKRECKSKVAKRGPPLLGEGQFFWNFYSGRQSDGCGGKDIMPTSSTTITSNTAADEHLICEDQVMQYIVPVTHWNASRIVPGTVSAFDEETKVLHDEDMIFISGGWVNYSPLGTKLFLNEFPSVSSVESLCEVLQVHRKHQLEPVLTDLLDYYILNIDKCAWPARIHHHI